MPTLTKPVLAVLRDSTYQASDKDPRFLGAEASTLGLAPGEWPRCVAVEGVAAHLWFLHFDYHDGDVAGARYRSADGDTLLIVND